MKIGAHVSAAGGLAKSLPRAAAIGAECAQIFVGAPQRWFSAGYPDEDVAEFQRLADELQVGPNVMHALYLVNLASTDATLRGRSINALINQMHWCERLGLAGLIVHVGSGKGAVAHEEALDLVIDGISQILSRSSSGMFLVENTAGMGSSIGSDFADIGTIFRRVGDDARLGVCLDTAHTFEAGYDIRTEDGVDAVFETFDREVGLDRLAAVHLNDSKTAFGSKVDRHENIGRGHLGEEGLGWFLTHPAAQNLPFYLEVPGVRGQGPDRENIDIARRLACRPALDLPATADAADAAVVIP